MTSHVLIAKRPATTRGEFPSVEITETQFEYHMVFPLSGIDPRKVYVFASPNSLLIEIRLISTIDHETTCVPVTESIDERVSRVFTLPAELEQGGTTIDVNNDLLQITARKARHKQHAPYPLLLAVPIAIISAISRAASRQHHNQRFFDAGTHRCVPHLHFREDRYVTYGRPTLVDVICAPGEVRERVLQMIASLEQYSKHPLASAISAAAKREGIPS